MRLRHSSVRKYSNTAASASCCCCCAAAAHSLSARVCVTRHASAFCVCAWGEKKNESDNPELRMFCALFGNSCEPEKLSRNRTTLLTLMLLRHFKGERTAAKSQAAFSFGFGAKTPNRPLSNNCKSEGVHINIQRYITLGAITVSTKLAP